MEKKKSSFKSIWVFFIAVFIVFVLVAVSFQYVKYLKFLEERPAEQEVLGDLLRFSTLNYEKKEEDNSIIYEASLRANLVNISRQQDLVHLTLLGLDRNNTYIDFEVETDVDKVEDPNLNESVNNNKSNDDFDVYDLKYVITVDYPEVSFWDFLFNYSLSDKKRELKIDKVLEKVSFNDDKNFDKAVITKSVFEWSKEYLADTEEGSKNNLSEGVLYYAGDDEIEILSESPRWGVFVLWGLSQGYSNELYDNETKESISDFIYSELYKYNEYSSIQTEDWGCNIMHDLYNNFTNCTDEKCEEIRDLAKRACLEDYFLGPLSEEVPDQPTVVDIIKERKTAMEESTPFYINTSTMVPLAAKASDTLAKYEWLEKDEDLIIWAKDYYEKAKSIYKPGKSESKGIYSSGVCTLGISALDLYRITNEQEYLKDAAAIADNIDWEEECIRFSSDRWSCYQNLNDSSRCIIFLNEYASLTGSASYYEFTDAFVKDIVNRRFDGEDFGGDIKGLGAFYTTTSYSDRSYEQGVYNYSAKLNGQMLFIINQD